MSIDLAVENKLRDMLDRHEIWQVLQRYGRGLDRFDRDLVRSCYFDDAIDDHGSFVGKVEDFTDWAIEVSRSCISHHHNVLNHYCELDGDDAYCETYFLCIRVVASPPHRMSMGRYIDHFQRRKGEWRIANRVTVVEGLFELDESKAAAARRLVVGAEGEQPVARNREDVSYHRPPRPRQARTSRSPTSSS